MASHRDGRDDRARALCRSQNRRDHAGRKPLLSSRREDQLPRRRSPAAAAGLCLGVNDARLLQTLRGNAVAALELKARLGHCLLTVSRPVIRRSSGNLATMRLRSSTIRQRSGRSKRRPAPRGRGASPWSYMAEAANPMPIATAATASRGTARPGDADRRRADARRLGQPAPPRGPGRLITERDADRGRQRSRARVDLGLPAGPVRCGKGSAVTELGHLVHKVKRLPTKLQPG
jgi:hypothetical protein